MKLNSDSVLLKNISNKTTGGLYTIYGAIPYTLYEVVEIGPGLYIKESDEYVRSTDVKVGDRVLVNNGVAQEINISKDGQKQKYYLVESVEECAIILDEDEGI